MCLSHSRADVYCAVNIVYACHAVVLWRGIGMCARQGCRVSMRLVLSTQHSASLDSRSRNVVCFFSLIRPQRCALALHDAFGCNYCSSLLMASSSLCWLCKQLSLLFVFLSRRLCAGLGPGVKAISTIVSATAGYPTATTTTTTNHLDVRGAVSARLPC